MLKRRRSAKDFKNNRSILHYPQDHRLEALTNHQDRWADEEDLVNDAHTSWRSVVNAIGILREYDHPAERGAWKMPLRDMDGEQMWLLPPSPDELLPLDHPARFVAELADALDREGWAELEGDPPLGAPAGHPRAVLCVWLYGFMTGVRSCRKLEAACRDQVPYLWLTGWQQPDHNTLWRFYQEHRQAMRKLFERTVRTAVSLELVGPGGSGGGWHEGGRQRGEQQERRCCGAA